MKKTKLERCKAYFLRRGCSEKVIDSYIHDYDEPKCFYELAKQIALAEYSFLRREYNYSDEWAKTYAKHTLKVLETALKRIYSDNS